MQATTAGCQLLFKLGAVGGVAMVRSPSGSPAFCSMGNFFVAIILYAALTVL
jgi:hypothetical protein